MKKYLIVFLFTIFYIEIQAQTWTYFPNTNGMSCQSIAVDSFNNKWFGTWDSGILKFDGVNWTKFTHDGSFKGVQSIAIDSHGNKWLGFGRFTKGVIMFDDINWASFNTSSGLVNDTVNCIVIDSKNNKWFGTNGGVSKFDGIYWTTYNTKNSGLINNMVLSIAIDFFGNIWFGTYNGLSKFDGLHWTNFSTANGLKYNIINSIGIDRFNNIWLASGFTKYYPPYQHYGALKYDGFKWTVYEASLDYNYIMSVVIDSQNNKWFGTDEGIFKFDEINWTAYNYRNNNSLKGAYYPAIAIDKQQNIWFGTMSGIGGITKYDPNTTKIISISKSETNIFPNPVNDFLTVKKTDFGLMKIQVFDLNGRKIIDKNTNYNILNIQSLSPNLYILKIDNYFYKFIKQ